MVDNTTASDSKTEEKLDLGEGIFDAIRRAERQRCLEVCELVRLAHPNLAIQRAIQECEHGIRELNNGD